MSADDKFYDLFFIYHPADIDRLRRVAAQTRATGVSCFFSEHEFGKSAEGIAQLKRAALRATTVAFALSPDSAESQLCNELLQGAMSQGKRLVTLILDEDIEVEVHPAIAQHPYVFFREGDDITARVDELRAYLRADEHLQLHTEFLTLAEEWRGRGRPPELLLPPDRQEEARLWLAKASARQPKPSSLQVEFIHSSRRQPPRRKPFAFRRIALWLCLPLLLGLVLFALQRAIAGWQEAQTAGALTGEAQTEAAQSLADATAASDSALGLIDEVAATSALLRTAVADTATAESNMATADAQVTRTAQAAAALRATRLRATEIAQMEIDEVGRRLAQAGEEALARGEVDTALALAWAAKDRLDDPKRAHRLLRRIAASSQTMILADLALLRMNPARASFAVVSGARDRLRLYDGESWALVNDLTEHDAALSTIAYSHDGAYLASASVDGAIVIRDAATGSAIRRLGGHRGEVTALAWRQSGDRLFSAGADPLLAAWDIESGAELARAETDEDGATALRDLAISSDGSRVIGWRDTGSRRAMAQWSADTLERLFADADGLVYRGYDAGARVAYSGGRSLPAYPGDQNTGDLVFWDMSAGSPLARLTDGFNWSFLSAESLASATDELRFIDFYQGIALVGVENSESGKRAALVNVDTGRVLREFKSGPAAHSVLGVFLDGERIVSARDDGRLALWSSRGGQLIREIASLPPNVESLRVNRPAKTVVALTSDGAAHFWRIGETSETPLRTLAEALPGTSLSPSGAALLHVQADAISLLHVETGEALRQLPGGAVGIASSSFAAREGARLRVYDMETGAELRGWDWAGGEVAALHPSPDGEMLLVVGDAGELWLARGESDAPQRLAGGLAQPALVRFSPDGGAILTLGADFVRLWDAESGLAESAYPLGAPSDAITQAAFSESGEEILFTLQMADGLAGLTALDPASKRARRTTFIDLRTAALSSDGETIALAFNNGALQVLRTADGEIIGESLAQPLLAQKLHVLPGAETLVIAARADLIFWDLSAGAIDQLFSHPAPVVDFSLSQNGERILSADEAGTYRLWQVESAEELLGRIAANHAPRGLTCAERERYLVAPLCE